MYQRMSELLLPILRRQEESDSGEPEAIVGFKRVLAGIYSHTSAFVVAAPMAHYIALEGSRFKFSHDHCWLPVEAAEKILDDVPLIMSFRNMGGKQVVFHNAMHYFHRPKDMEHMCMYQFFREIECMPKSKTKGQECFEMKSTHPCHSCDVAVYRTRPCIPVFPWKFLKSTMCFETSILTPGTSADSDYAVKEEYAKRFQLLFLPFRTADDIKVDGSFQQSLREKKRKLVMT